MTDCTKCEFTGTVGDSFCRQCGTEHPEQDQHSCDCGVIVHEDDNFCHNCGSEFDSHQEIQGPP